MADRAPLRVPPSEVSALREIASLAPERVEAISNVFTSHSAADRGLLIREIAEQSGKSNEVASAILFTVTALEAMRANEGWTVDAVRERLTDAEQFPGKTRAERRALADKVASLLGHPVVELLYTAHQAIIDNERTYQSARVQTDLRPVFVGDEKEAPAAFVLLHELKISSYRPPDGRIESLTFALDDRDIELLEETLSDARARAAALRAAIAPIGVAVASPLDGPGDDE